MAALLSGNSICLEGHGAERLPVETFARGFTYDTVEISPGGTKVAVTYLREDTEFLAVIDLTSDKATILSRAKRPDVMTGVRWKSDERLIYLLFARGRNDWPFAAYYAVNADGSNKVPLDFNWKQDGDWSLDTPLDGDWQNPNSLLFTSYVDRDRDAAVYRVDIERYISPAVAAVRTTGPAWPTKRRKLFQAPDRECRYMTDNAGVVRTCVTNEEENTQRLLYRSGEGAEWTKIADIAFGDRLQPIGFTPDDRQLYVLSNVGRNTIALFVYDPQKKAVGEQIFEAEGVDLAGDLRGGDGRKLIGVTYNQNGKGVYYLDPKLVSIHQGLNQAFPGLQVRLDSFSRDERKIVVWVGDSSTPGAYYLYDRDKASVRILTDIAPWIVREKMALTRPIEFDARDGVHLHGYLTLPRGVPAKSLPLIVNVHGGPHGVRDTADFDRETQLFANRGYAVLQINFRGSGGYGREFFNAGKREWGRKMQTDLEDGVNWLVKRGTVDAARVGIFGGSYGGYATMMALIKAPDMFKCGVTYAGVSNLVRMLNAGAAWDRSGTLGRNIGKDERMWWETVIGDRHDEAGLREISPLFNVDKVKAPVFIAHGTEDLTVPVEEATDLNNALRRAGKPVEMLIVPREGHGFFQSKNRELFYERMDAFFAKYLPTNPPT